jgi:hypothetical protein
MPSRCPLDSFCTVGAYPNRLDGEGLEHTNRSTSVRSRANVAARRGATAPTAVHHGAARETIQAHPEYRRLPIYAILAFYAYHPPDIIHSSVELPLIWQGLTGSSFLVDTIPGAHIDSIAHVRAFTHYLISYIIFGAKWWARVAP